MADDISAKVEGLDELNQYLAEVKDGLSKFDKAMTNACLIVERYAREGAPVDTGRLRASITHEIRHEGTDTIGVVGSNVEYAPWMEEGTGVFGSGNPHWPPGDALEVWAKRHGFSSGYQVAAAIGRRGGLQGRKFLQKAFDEHKNEIEQILDSEVSAVIERTTSLKKAQAAD